MVAPLVFLLAAATLCWPMLSGGFLLGDDQYVAGYGFRLFGAEYFRATGHIPEWNPYLFGGLPYIAALHGDIFYPSAWLRWILPVDTAMNLEFFAHLVLAGAAMYGLLRALRLRWTGALVGGLAYELSGIVAPSRRSLSWRCSAPSGTGASRATACSPSRWGSACWPLTFR